MLLSGRRPPIPGATVVPLRDGPGGLEVLLVRRAATIAYGGMWAFPGGRVDPADAGPGRPNGPPGSGDDGQKDPVVAAGRRPVAPGVREDAGAPGHRIVLWHGDAGYAAGDPDRPGTRHRLVMADHGWAFEHRPGPT